MLKLKSLAGLLITACSINAFAANQPVNLLLGHFTTFNAKTYAPFVLNANPDLTEWNFNSSFNGLPNDANDVYFTSVYCKNTFCLSGGFYRSILGDDPREFKNKALIFKSNDAGY